MRTYQTWNKLSLPHYSCVALGYFDGVHIGHRAVLAQTAEAARVRGVDAAVFTFSPPADRAVKGKTILTQTEKLRRLGTQEISLCLCPPFEDFCSLSPERFVREVLHDALHAVGVFCGENFTFGKNRAGDIDTLYRLGDVYGIGVYIVPLTEWEGAPVSSTRIRAAAREGDLPAVNAMLGEPYAIDLPVRHGKRLGSTLGFPTINQVYPDAMLLPREGVYATAVRLNGAWLPAATGLGTRPTVNGVGVTCETFIPDFSGELYDEAVTVRFLRYLWPTEKFSSLDGLTDMIRRAVVASKQIAAGIE